MSKYLLCTFPGGVNDGLDYCVAAFGIILVISTFQWIIDGRKNFTGPRMDVDVAVAEAVHEDTAGKGPEAEHAEK